MVRLAQPLLAPILCLAQVPRSKPRWLICVRVWTVSPFVSPNSSIAAKTTDPRPPRPKAVDFLVKEEGEISDSTQPLSTPSNNQVTSSPSLAASKPAPTNNKSTSSISSVSTRLPPILKPTPVHALSSNHVSDSCNTTYPLPTRCRNTVRLSTWNLLFIDVLQRKLVHEEGHIPLRTAYSIVRQRPGSYIPIPNDPDCSIM